MGTYLLGLESVGLECPTWVNSLLDILLLLSSLQNPLLNSSLGDQSVHKHILCLTNPVSSVGGLGIHGWVPIIVIEDDRVRCGESHTQPTGSGREKKDENIRIILKFEDHVPAVLDIQGALD